MAPVAKSAYERVVELRQKHQPAVLANLVNNATLWGRPCHAFNVHIEPSAAARRGLADIQDALLAVEPTLRRCPGPTLHISVAWLLAVHVEYAESKASIWDRHGERWTEDLTSIARRHKPFDLRYRWPAVTDTAVVAIAAPIEPVRRLREDIDAHLDLPQQTNNAVDLVHTTLFRFRSTLSNPAGLIHAADDMNFEVPTTVRRLIISEELSFPSLATATQAKIPLHPSRPR